MSGVWRTNKGIYFGFASDSTENPPPDLVPHGVWRYADDRHIVTVGPNGSGKSKRLLLPNLAYLKDWSIVVVDPKGELATMTREHREKKGSKIRCLNPFNANNLGSDGFNPLLALDPESDDFPDDAMRIAEALIRVEGNEPHFSQAAQDLVCAFIMYACLAIEKPSLTDVRDFLSLDAEGMADLILGEQIEHGEADAETGKRPLIDGLLTTATKKKCPALARKASRYGDISPEAREMSSVISTALTQTRWLDSGPIQEDLKKGRYDFGRLKEEPTTVYLILPANRLGSHSTWLRLMITSILQPLLKDTRKSSVPVLLMLDEFAQLGHLPVIEQTVALMRGYGVKLWAVFQNLGQARAMYGTNWEGFVANAGVLQAFAPSDLFTADYLSKQTGQTTVPFITGSGNSGGQASINESVVAVPRMLPQELRYMDDGFSVIFSNKLKGTLRTYMPYPKPEIFPEMAEILALDPSA